MNKQMWGITVFTILAIVGFLNPIENNIDVQAVKQTRTNTSTVASTNTTTRTATQPTNTASLTATSTQTKTNTPVPLTVTSAITGTSTITLTVQSSATSTNTPTQGSIIMPYPNAPLCTQHSTTTWHGLWDFARGCHYDHEHGQNPFSQDVSLAFQPIGDLQTLLGGVQIGHTNLSSPMENTHKHGGFKWQVALSAPQGCLTGFEGGDVAIKAYAIQFHAFGRQDTEHEVRNHSSAGVLKFCKSNNPNDVGYMYFTQLQEYGVRVMPYQGMVLPYPDNFLPIWDGRRGQYFTTECFGNDFTVTEVSRGSIFVDCRSTSSDINNNNTLWTSKISGTGLRPQGSTLFTLLFRGRDNYQRLASSDLLYPFTWRFVCGGLSYTPAGCRFNSSTMTIHEIRGTIPSEWDNLSGWDTDSRIGRVSAEGFVDRFGTILADSECQQAGDNCHPIKLVSVFVGTYSSEISINKVSNPTPLNTPERDIYFCNEIVCSETSPNAVPSGWIGSEN